MSAVWNYGRNGQTLGPVSEEQLRAMLASGELGREDLVWREGMDGWRAAGQVPELALAPEVAASPRPLVPGVSPGVVGLLQATKPWVRFLAILGFIGTGLLALVGLVMGMLPSGPFGSMPLFGRFALAAVYLVMAALQLPPVIFLNRFASRIADLVASGRPEDLEAALGAQKSFWKYLGILTLVVICLYAMVILGVVLVAVIVAAKR